MHLGHVTPQNSFTSVEIESPIMNDVIFFHFVDLKFTLQNGTLVLLFSTQVDGPMLYSTISDPMTDKESGSTTMQ